MSDSDEQADLENNTQKWAEKNFKSMKKKMKKLTKEMRNNKPQENINVRKVDGEQVGQDDDQIVVEYTVSRWYSINYFKKMIEEEDENPMDDEEKLFE